MHASHPRPTTLARDQPGKARAPAAALAPDFLPRAIARSRRLVETARGDVPLHRPPDARPASQSQACRCHPARFALRATPAGDGLSCMAADWMGDVADACSV